MLPTGTPANRKPNVYAFHLNAYICQPFQPGTKRIAYFAQIGFCFSHVLTENQTYYSNAMDATEEEVQCVSITQRTHANEISVSTFITQITCIYNKLRKPRTSIDIGWQN